MNEEEITEVITGLVRAVQVDNNYLEIRTWLKKLSAADLNEARHVTWRVKEELDAWIWAG